jgi:CheY-like chemotaxis protein
LVRVLCVDDQAYFRRVLRGLIAGTPGFIQVGEASSGEEAIIEAADLQPDLVLIDVRMPGIDGWQTAATLLGGNWAPFIVLMSADPIEPPSALAARAGEVVFVFKGELSPHRLLDLWQGRRTS